MNIKIYIRVIIAMIVLITLTTGIFIWDAFYNVKIRTSNGAIDNIKDYVSNRYKLNAELISIEIIDKKNGNYLANVKYLDGISNGRFSFIELNIRSANIVSQF